MQQPSTPKGSPSKLPRARPTTLPAFAVPLGVDPYNEEGYRSGKTLERFVAMLTRGVGVNLAMDGCGTLHVVASLDAQCTLLHLVYNGVDKTIPLSFIRSLAVDLFYAGQTPPVKQRVSEKPRAWCVCMELGDKHFCTFVFGDNQAGQREATFFAQCMRMLSESVRFESTKLELQQISFGKLPLESPHASARTVVSEDIGIPSATEGLNALALDVALRNLRSERSHRRGIDAC